MMAEIEKDISKKMDKALEALEHDLSSLRTGRASTNLLDDVTVDAYGTDSPLKGVASVSCPDGKSIVIQPWDKNLTASIEKAILSGNLGFTPNNDGKVIRINIPPLTEDRRKDLVKLAHTIVEKARVAIRNVRRHGNDELKKAERDHDISENERDLAMEKIQKQTDGHIEQVASILKVKEAEIMEV